MRFLTSFLCVLLLSGISVAQKKFLVSPNQEVIPIQRGSSAQKMIAKYQKDRKAASVTADCSGEATFGFDPDHFPVDSRFGFSHKDVLGEWFVAPARGTIDTFFIIQPAGSTISAVDSQVIARIFQSNIGPGHGPGYDYPRPCQSWGTWFATSDPENGVAPFREDATDTTWHSTILGNTPSFPPFGLSCWGLTGVAVQIVSQGITAIPMDIIPGGFVIKPHTVSAKDTIDIGEPFFFSLKMNSQIQPQSYPDANPTQFGASGNNPPYPPYPARNWKFYEHDSGPSNCAGQPFTEIKKGWVARGPLVDDTTAGACYDVWYVMTPTTNVPPKINSVDGPANTTASGSQTITAEIFDCDAENAAKAGVASTTMKYTVTDLLGSVVSSGTTSLDNIGGDTFLGTLPGTGGKNRIMRYQIFAYDSLGLADSTVLFQYKVVDFNSSFYRCDTALGCTPASIVGTGTVIDTSKWFITSVGSTATHKGDDGTAGPYALGGPFIYYGDTVNYAWIGVNGAIALSKTATDTLDVNSNGFATDGFDFPQRQNRGRTDTTRRSAGFMPRNFIAPYWGDWITKQDSPIATFGHIRYRQSGNTFTAEWDSVGDFDASGAVVDNAKFRVILDRSTGSIQFQYDDIGVGGLDTVDLVGMNSDSTTHPAFGALTPFNFFNKDGFPLASHLHAGLCVTYYPSAFSTAAIDGWNMVSVGQNAPSFAKPFLYPTAVSNSAFGYNGSYQPTQTLANGPGYWVKFSGAQSLDAPGSHRASVDDALNNGWNMVGSVSSPVAVGTLTTTPPGITTSPYFGFGGSYTVATTLTPGKAYWVKTNAAGTLHIVGTGAVPKTIPEVAELAALSKVTISDKLNRAQTLYIGSDATLSAQAASRYEMPPAAPDGALNVRYATGRMVEVYPSVPEAGKDNSYAIMIQGAVYPLTVKWESARGSAQQIALLALNGKDTKTLGIVEGTGKVTINDAGVTKLALKVTEGLAVPKEFALSQNYPNPFNPTTHFSVDIPKASSVDITVYDVLGRRIATLMSGEQEAGYHIMEWDSKDSHGLAVPSGMYMVRMTAGDFSAVRKIMLMK